MHGVASGILTKEDDVRMFLKGETEELPSNTAESCLLSSPQSKLGNKGSPLWQWLEVLGSKMYIPPHLAWADISKLISIDSSSNLS